MLKKIDLKNKIALITGAGKGLGKACAESLAMEGVEIFINGIQEENLKKTEKEFLNKGYKVTAILGAMEDSTTREALLKAIAAGTYTFEDLIISLSR